MLSSRFDDKIKHMEINPEFIRESKGKIPPYQSPQERKVARQEEGLSLSKEETIAALMKRAAIVIEKDQKFTSYVQSLLNNYGSSDRIAQILLNNKSKDDTILGRQPEMAIAVARILEAKH